MNMNENEYPIEYFKKQLYRKYLDAIFPDFNSENYEMTDKLIEEIEKFHLEFSKCVVRINFAEEIYKEIFGYALNLFLVRILEKIVKAKTFKEKQDSIKDFELLMDKATNTISLDNNFRTKACLNTTKVKWKSHLYGIMVGLIV